MCRKSALWRIPVISQTFRPKRSTRAWNISRKGRSFPGEIYRLLVSLPFPRQIVCPNPARLPRFRFAISTHRFCRIFHIHSSLIALQIRGVLLLVVYLFREVFQFFQGFSFTHEGPAAFDQRRPSQKPDLVDNLKAELASLKMTLAKSGDISQEKDNLEKRLDDTTIKLQSVEALRDSLEKQLAESLAESTVGLQTREDKLRC